MSIPEAETRPPQSERVLKTYVEGFDEALDGGIPPSHVVLISGAPGTMKSTLAFSILYNNAKEASRTASI